MLVSGYSGYMFTSNKQSRKTEREREREITYSFLNINVIFNINSLHKVFIC